LEELDEKVSYQSKEYSKDDIVNTRNNRFPRERKIREKIEPKTIKGNFEIVDIKVKDNYIVVRDADPEAEYRYQEIIYRTDDTDLFQK
jgi:hypothetical protein